MDTEQNAPLPLSSFCETRKRREGGRRAQRSKREPDAPHLIRLLVDLLQLLELRSIISDQLPRFRSEEDNREGAHHHHRCQSRSSPGSSERPSPTPISFVPSAPFFFSLPPPLASTHKNKRRKLSARLLHHLGHLPSRPSVHVPLHRVEDGAMPLVLDVLRERVERGEQGVGALGGRGGRHGGRVSR